MNNSQLACYTYDTSYLKVFTMVLWWTTRRSDEDCYSFCRDMFNWETPYISCWMDTKRKLFTGKLVWCRLTYNVAGILPVAYDYNPIRMLDLSCYSCRNYSQNTDLAWFELITGTNIPINDSGCPHVVHILCHPRSRPTVRSTHNALVNAQKKNITPVSEGKYGA
jgi:hypothetical protein